MSSAVAAHRRAFGSDTVPGCYEDLDIADAIVLVGSNTAWCHPILFRRMVDARVERGTKLVVIDPRRTETAEEADLFLGIRPGSDSALFSGLLVHLDRAGACDARFVADHTAGYEGALERAQSIAPTIAATAAGDRPFRGRRRRLLRPVHGDEAHRHRLLPRGEPVGARDRQGQRDHQLPPRHRPDRAAGHGAVLAHRPAQRHGRARGRRAGQHARRPHALRAGGGRQGPPLLERPEPHHRRGDEGGRPVRRDRAGQDQGALGDGDQSPRLDAAGRHDQGGVAGASTFSSSPR